LLKGSCIEALEEEAAVIAKDMRLDQQHFWNNSSRNQHQKISWQQIEACGAASIQNR
jgi:hypothetical protein